MWKLKILFTHSIKTKSYGKSWIDNEKKKAWSVKRKLLERH